MLLILTTLRQDEQVQAAAQLSRALSCASNARLRTSAGAADQSDVVMVPCVAQKCSASVQLRVSRRSAHDQQHGLQVRCGASSAYLHCVRGTQLSHNDPPGFTSTTKQCCDRLRDKVDLQVDHYIRASALCIYMWRTCELSTSLYVKTHSAEIARLLFAEVAQHARATIDCQ